MCAFVYVCCVYVCACVCVFIYFVQKKKVTLLGESFSPVVQEAIGCSKKPYGSVAVSPAPVRFHSQWLLALNVMTIG